MSALKCPWCEAEPLWNPIIYVRWQCGSTAHVRDGRLTDDLPRTQSDACRLQELEAKLTRLQAVLEPFAEVGRSVPDDARDACDWTTYFSVRVLREAAQAAGERE